MRFMHFDRWGQPKGDGTLHGVITAKRSRGTDGTDTLTLTLAGDTVEQGDMIAYHDSRGRLCEHSVGVPETVRADAIPVTTVTCDSSLAELQLKGIPYLKTTGGAQGMLATILDGTRWTLGTVQANGATTATIELKDSNTLAALQEIANTFDLEITTERAMSADRMRITGRTVHLKARSGDITGRRVSYGKDLKEIRRTLSATRPITRLYVYGKSAAGVDEGTDGRATISSVNDGKPYLDADPTLLDLYGRPGPDGEMLPADGFVEYSDIDDPNELLRLGKGELAKRSQPKVTYEASATTLQKAGMGVDGIDLGDTIQVVDTTFPTPLRLEARVLKIEEDLLDDAGATSLTFGNITDTLTSQSKKVQNTVQKLWSGSGAWDDAANLSGGYLDGVIAGINTQMNKTGGYTYLIPGEGLYVYDKPKREDGSDRDATMAIQIGGGYFRIANSRKSDGTWAWRTMGTGAGLVCSPRMRG